MEEQREAGVNVVERWEIRSEFIHGEGGEWDGRRGNGKGVGGGSKVVDKVIGTRWRILG